MRRLVTDPGNQRISILGASLELYRQFEIPRFVNDIVAATSDGDIYLLSRSGIKAISRYNNLLKLKSSLLDINKHLEFPFLHPDMPKLDLRIPNDHELIHRITKNNELVIVSNYSLRAFVFDRRDNLINEFSIIDLSFAEDFKRRLSVIDKPAVQQNGARIRAIRFILPFTIFLDSNSHLNLVYYNSSQRWELRKYNLNGKYVGIWEFPNSIDGSPICADNLGNVVVTTKNRTEIEVYKFISIRGGNS